MDAGAVPVRWWELRERWTPVESEVIDEALVTIYVNAQELVTIMCTPRDQDDLALGFLRNEGLLDSRHEVDHVYVSPPGCCVDVWLRRSFTRPTRRIITSGCGGGVTFDDPSLGVEPLDDPLRLEPAVLFDLFRALHAPDSLHARARGVHGAGLSDGRRLLALCEDVGRHNTIDKLAGRCLREGLETRGRVLLTTGRVSSEMLHKAARMGCPLVASRNSPTSLSVAMAQAWNITLIGYVRQRSMRVYAHPERLIPSPQAAVEVVAGAAGPPPAREEA